MNLFETKLADNRNWSRIGDAYAVTKKPRGLSRFSIPIIPFAAMEAIPQDGTYSPNFTMKAPDAIASGTYFESGNILISKITPSFENGKQALVRKLNTPFGYATTEVIPLHPLSNQHDSRFLFFYMLHSDVRHYVAERMEGSTGRKRVPEDVLLEVPIPEINLNEQISIADALEVVKLALFTEVQCEQSAQNLKHAAMHELFTKGLHGKVQKETDNAIGEKITINTSWSLHPLGDLFEIGAGKTMSAAARAGEDKTPFLRTSNVLWNKIDLTAIDEMFIPAHELQSKLLRPGDLLVCEGGEVGRAAIWNGEKEVMSFQNHLHRLRPLRKDVDPRFYVYFLQCAFTQLGIFEGASNKTTIPNLSRGRLAALPMPHPEINEQREIANILDAIESKINFHQRKRAILDKLFKALLHKLMIGEIRVADLDISALDSQSTSKVAA